MLIEQLMNKQVITVRPTNTIAHVAKLMQERHVRHIVVTNAQRHVVGIVGQFEMNRVTSVFHPENRQTDVQNAVSSIMRRDIATAHPLDFVEDVVALFYEQQLSALPIVEHNQLVGIVTETELLRYFVRLTGALEPSSQIEVRVTNTTVALEKISRLLEKTNVNIINVFVYPTDDGDDRILSFRIQTMNPLRVIERLKKEGYDVLQPEMTP